MDCSTSINVTHYSDRLRLLARNNDEFGLDCLIRGFHATTSTCTYLSSHINIVVESLLFLDGARQIRPLMNSDRTDLFHFQILKSFFFQI